MIEYFNELLEHYVEGQMNYNDLTDYQKGYIDGAYAYGDIIKRHEKEKNNEN